jgi:hypothetical protein
MCDVVKHEKHKLEIQEAMMYIMAPATKQTKFAAYEDPALVVVNLTEKQFSELTQEQHPVNDWNRITLVIKAGRFENELEYEEIKHRASKKSVFSQSFTLRNKVKFRLEVIAPSVQEINLEASAEVQSLLKPHLSVMEGAAHAPKGKEWVSLCMYVQMLNAMTLDSRSCRNSWLLGVDDELGAALAELGTGDGVSGGGHM